MKLLVQPEDGVRPLVKAVASARRSIEAVIFRFDQPEIERALANAVGRGVAVHALIANTNRSGEESLRKLEMRLLAAGVIVSRTADDLVRYHGKLILIDRRDLYLLAFNLTHADIERSRSFGLVTKKPAVIREAVRLFEADTRRHPYEPASDSMVVSPVNARRLLSAFIKRARKELLVYDPKVSDRAMIRLLEERAAAGVRIRILGRMTRVVPGIKTCKLSQMRLHTRTMVRDGRDVFVGSQSLRSLELDARREVGLIFRDARAVSRLRQAFAADWSRAEQGAESVEAQTPAVKVARRVAKVLAKDLPPVAPVLNGIVKEIVGETSDVDFDPVEVEEVVKGAVREAVREAVSGIVEGAVDDESGDNE